MIYQLNVNLPIGDKTPEGHTLQGWARSHIEFFDSLVIAEQARKEWESVGITAKFGKLSEKANV